MLLPLSIRRADERNGYRVVGRVRLPEAEKEYYEPDNEVGDSR